MFDQPIEASLSAELIDTTFSGVEPFIEQIQVSEVGKIHKKTHALLTYYYDIASSELKNRLKDAYPKAYQYIHELPLDELPPHVDHWTEAKVGDIIRKTGTHYASTLQNGQYYIVLEVYSGDDTAVVLDTDGQLKTACFPEEYEVVGNVSTLLAERKTSIREQAKVRDSEIWESNGLSLFERKYVDKLRLEGKEDEIIAQFTDKWKTYYELGEKTPSPFDDLFKDI